MFHFKTRKWVKAKQKKEKFLHFLLFLIFAFNVLEKKILNEFHYIYCSFFCSFMSLFYSFDEKKIFFFQPIVIYNTFFIVEWKSVHWKNFPFVYGYLQVVHKMLNEKLFRTVDKSLQIATIYGQQSFWKFIFMGLLPDCFYEN